MKKILLFLLLITCMLSCIPTDYTIEGIVDNPALNGTTISIRERVNRVWKTIDSTKIQNGKFSFVGVCDSSRIAYLSYEFPSDNRVRQAFVYENGKLTVKIDTAGFMKFTGTKQNKLLQAYHLKKHISDVQIETYYRLNKDNMKTPGEKAGLDKEISELQKNATKIDVDYATKFVNTLVGTYVFTSSYYDMTIEQKEGIISLMDDETKQSSRIADIITALNIEKQTTVGSHFADFKLATLSGDSISLSSLVGKSDYVLVDFWASWCGPCVQFIPCLKRMNEKYSGSRLKILSVSLDDSKEAWQSAVKNHKMTWLQISDLKGWRCLGAQKYAVNSIPSTVLIDKTGVIVGKNMTEFDIQKILDKK